MIIYSYNNDLNKKKNETSNLAINKLLSLIRIS